MFNRDIERRGKERLREKLSEGSHACLIFVVIIEVLSLSNIKNS
jgi:hypothetical protein